jgi:hypothetical protein
VSAIAALIYTAESLNATRDQIDAARDQISVSEQGQMTDRYSRAVEQLGQQGSDKLHIRLGGIYALERLARDSPRDQPTIHEILATFIRTTAPSAPVSAPVDAFQFLPKFACPADAPKSPTPDVQAALEVLARRDISHDVRMLDLSRSCLRGLTYFGLLMDEAGLSFMNLGDVDLSDATLRANFSNSSLTGARLKGATLSQSRLSGSSLLLADLTDASLWAADLGGAVLARANLTRANLAGANLEGANLDEANLTGADLTGASHDSSTSTQDVQADGTTKGRWR